MIGTGQIRALGAVAVFVTVVATFAVNARNEFVRIDDYDYIAQNPHIQNGLTPRSVAWSFAAVGYASNWHPLTWLSHAADVTIARALGLDYAEVPNPVGVWAKVRSSFARFVHGENVALHAANAVLLYFVILALIRPSAARPSGVGDAAVAAVCALLWAVHPLRVEVVAWASERKELLSVCFMLLTLIAYCSGQHKQKLSSTVDLDLFPRPSFYYTFSLFTFTFSLLAKPVAVALPAVLVAVDLFRGERDWRRIVERVSPFVLLSAVACLLTMQAQTGALSQGGAFPWKVRLAAALAAPAVYLRQTVWPVGLCLDYAMPTWGDAPWIAAGAVLHLAVLASGVLWLRAAFRGRAASFGWRLVPLAVAWCYVCLIPMLGIVKVGYEPHSDRYTYWVGCGLAAVVALVLARTEPTWRSMAGCFALLAAVPLCILVNGTVERSRVWANNVALMSDMVGQTRNPFMAHVLASEYAVRGEHAKAGAMLRDVAEGNPCACSFGALAWHLARRGDDDEAERWADRAFEREPENVFALGAKGLILKNRGKRAEAVPYLERSLRQNADRELSEALEACTEGR